MYTMPVQNKYIYGMELYLFGIFWSLSTKLQLKLIKGWPAKSYNVYTICIRTRRTNARETLDFTIRIGSPPTSSHLDSYLYSAYAAHYTFIYIYIYIYMPIASKVLYMKWCRIRVFIHDAVFKPIQLVYHIHFMPFSNDFHTGIVYRRKTNRTLFHIVFIQSYLYRVNGVMYTALHIGTHFTSYWNTPHFMLEHRSVMITLYWILIAL